jgi:hypothetical protein
VQTAVALSKAGYHYVGALKTASACFPKTYLQGVLQPLPAGSKLVLEATYQGVDLLAIGYKYNRRKVLFFVATRGAGTTTPGEPYVQRWADDHGNLCVREISRPAILSEYFAASNAVDLHNQSRQSDLGLEDRWPTKDCWFRLLTTLFGMVVTDCWKAVRHHVGKHHRLQNSTVMNFADELAYALLTNGLSDLDRPSRASERLAMADATNLPYNVATAHLPVQYPKAWNGKRPQHRCRFCLVKRGMQSWTTYYCSKCEVPLCAVCNRGGRDCFEAHLLCGPDEFNTRHHSRPAKYPRVQ